MPIITRRFPHLIQPQYPVKVNQSNPLTKGLQDVAVLGNTLRWNAARNTFLSSNGTVNSDPRGPIITTDATAYSVPGGYSAPPITVIIGFARVGAPTSGNHALWISLDAATGNQGLYLRYEDVGTLRLIKSQVAGIGSGAFTVKPQGSLMGMAIDAGTYALYGDGRLITSGTHAVAFNSDTPVIGSESSNATEDHPSGIFYFYAVWDRILSADEFRRISDNPWQLYAPRKRQIYVSAASGGQTLTPSLYTDADTFYSAAVSYDVTLTPALFSDADTFYAATVSAGAVTLTPALYGDADTFYSATVVVDGGPQTLTPSLYADADTFHAPTVTPGAVSLAPSIYTDADTFHAATVAASYNLQPAAHADADTFYSATVSQTGDAVLQPGLFTDADTFYTATVASVMFLSAPRQLSSNTQTARRSNKQTARRP